MLVWLCVQEVANVATEQDSRSSTDSTTVEPLGTEEAEASADAGAKLYGAGTGLVAGAKVEAVAGRELRTMQHFCPPPVILSSLYACCRILAVILSLNSCVAPPVDKVKQ